MISIIVIGRNESESLGTCFTSIHEFAAYNELSDYEILYIDSDSNDKSIQIAKEHDVHRIIKLEKHYNAAVAMNTGAEYASKNYILILGGDMRLINFSLNKFISQVDKKTIVTGRLVEKLVNKDGYVEGSYVRNYPKGVCGGVSIMLKDVFFRIGAMDERMKKGQDYDFFLRASKMGYDLVELDTTICEHHTESYRSKNRIKITSFLHSLYRGILLRKNILNLKAIKLICREFYPLILLISGFIIWSFSNLDYLLILPFMLFLLANLYKLRKEIRFDTFFFEIVRQFVFLFSIVFFFPFKKSHDSIIIK